MNRKITSWAGKRVWIIGASSGIGAACATQLLAQGASVALSARHRASLEQLCEGQPLALALPLDITQQAQVRAVRRTQAAVAAYRPDPRGRWRLSVHARR
jgi:NADP-dependent 3-hydroxy acid dehydrogenase YdfG